MITFIHITHHYCNLYFFNSFNLLNFRLYWSFLLYFWFYCFFLCSRFSFNLRCIILFFNLSFFYYFRSCFFLLFLFDRSCFLNHWFFNNRFFNNYFFCCCRFFWNHFLFRFTSRFFTDRFHCSRL